MRTDSGGPQGLLNGIFHRLARSKYFTALDLASGVFQILIKEVNNRTAFRDTIGRLWEYERAGFGLKMLPRVFSQFISSALGGILRVNDILLSTSVVFEEHLKHVDEVLKRLISVARVSVNCASLDYLWVGVEPSPVKVEAVQQMQPPQMVGSLRTFLDMTGYLRQFILQYSQIAALRSEVLRGKVMVQIRLARKTRQGSRAENLLRSIKMKDNYPTGSFVPRLEYDLPFFVYRCY
ncbi:unnamed protein product [Discosporangium mesarthrocarpum]